MEVDASVTVFAEGTRGSLAKEPDRDERLGLMEGRNPQTYGTGIKEIWQVAREVGKEMLRQGRCTRAATRSTRRRTAARGSTASPRTSLSLGFVVGLDQGDAASTRTRLFVQWKQHPRIAGAAGEGGKVVRYGAKTIPERRLLLACRSSSGGRLRAGGRHGRAS